MFNLESKCANPACPTLFDWQLHGKFYRFYRDRSHVNEYCLCSQSASCSCGVEHFWLCEACSLVFTLAYKQEHGIVVRPRGFERRAAEQEELTAAQGLRPGAPFGGR
jgi:hypothetical protein